MEARKALFRHYLSKLRLASEGVDISSLAQMTKNKSGADIREICNQAGLNAFQRESDEGSRNYLLSPLDIETALETLFR